MAKLKVYGGLERGRGKAQVRTIVATTSANKAAGLLGVSIGLFRNYYCETSNDIELKTALAEPEVIFQASSSMGDDFIKVILE